LSLQCPTTVIPFFGDQPFWGGRIHEKGVGPVPIPVKSFSVEKLVDAIKFMLNPEVCYSQLQTFMNIFRI
jgi:sterol 3beta-glucosyltransferase